MTGEIAEHVIHGGDLDAARALYPDVPGPWLDLSTGINPIPYAVPALPPEAWTRLPQPRDELALRRAAAARFGAVDPAMVVAAPGTQALIQLLPRQFRPTRVAVLGPTYAEHVRSWMREDHHVEQVASLEHALESGATIVVVVNPDNPTGRLISPEALSRAARRLQDHGLLVVDEAFVEAAGDGASLVPGLPPGALVLRSFGKIYGLAGLRLGFAVAPTGLADAMRAGLGPWAVSGPALEIGRVALENSDWLAGARSRLERDAGRLDGLLARHGARSVGGTWLFRLVAHPSAAELARALGQHAIHVRQFAHAPGRLRFGIPGDDEAWRRLGLALATFG